MVKTFRRGGVYSHPNVIPLRKNIVARVMKDVAILVFSCVAVATGALFAFLGWIAGDLPLISSLSALFRSCGGLLVFLGVFGGVIWFMRSRPSVHWLTSSMPIQQYEAKVFRRWRTDRGVIVSSEDVELEEPRYWVSLVTKDGKRLDVETSEKIYEECLEQSWGYAWVQGSWLGSFQRSVELYLKHES